MHQEPVVKDNEQLRNLVREKLFSLFSLDSYIYSSKDLVKYIEDFFIPSLVYYYYEGKHRDFGLYIKNIEKDSKNFKDISKRITTLLTILSNDWIYGNAKDVRVLGDVHPGGSTKFLSNRAIRYNNYPYYNNILEKVTGLVLGDYGNYFPTIRKDNSGLITREYVEIRKETKKRSEIKRYYYNLGRFIPVLLLLRAIDINAENILINLPYPKFFDMETVFSAEFEKNILDYDLTNTGVIKVFGDMDSSLLTGGLSPIQSYLKPILVGNNINPEVIWKVKSRNKYHNIPILNGEKVFVGNYIEELLKGYRESCKRILLKRKEILKLRFSGDNYIRVLLRPTRVYRLITLQSSYPQVYNVENTREFMRKKLDEYGLIHMVDTGQLLSIELDCMENFQVPVFYCNLKSKEIISPDGRVAAKFLVSPNDFWNDYVKKEISKEFFERQESLIEESIKM